MLHLLALKDRITLEVSTQADRRWEGGRATSLKCAQCRQFSVTLIAQRDKHQNDTCAAINRSFCITRWTPHSPHCIPECKPRPRFLLYSKEFMEIVNLFSRPELCETMKRIHNIHIDMRSSDYAKVKKEAIALILLRKQQQFLKEEDELVLQQQKAVAAEAAIQQERNRRLLLQQQLLSQQRQSLQAALNPAQDLLIHQLLNHHQAQINRTQNLQLIPGVLMSNPQTLPEILDQQRRMNLLRQQQFTASLLMQQQQRPQQRPQQQQQQLQQQQLQQQQQQQLSLFLQQSQFNLAALLARDNLPRVLNSFTAPQRVFGSTTTAERTFNVADHMKSASRQEGGEDTNETAQIPSTLKKHAIESSILPDSRNNGTNSNIISSFSLGSTTKFATHDGNGALLARTMQRNGASNDIAGDHFRQILGGPTKASLTTLVSKQPLMPSRQGGLLEQAARGELSMKEMREGDKLTRKRSRDKTPFKKRKKNKQPNQQQPPSKISQSIDAANNESAFINDKIATMRMFLPDTIVEKSDGERMGKPTRKPNQKKIRKLMPATSHFSTDKQCIDRQQKKNERTTTYFLDGPSEITERMPDEAKKQNNASAFKLTITSLSDQRHDYDELNKTMPNTKSADRPATAEKPPKREAKRKKMKRSEDAFKSKNTKESNEAPVVTLPATSPHFAKKQWELLKKSSIVEPSCMNKHQKMFYLEILEGQRQKCVEAGHVSFKLKTSRRSRRFQSGGPKPASYYSEIENRKVADLFSKCTAEDLLDLILGKEDDIIPIEDSAIQDSCEQACEKEWIEVLDGELMDEAACILESMAETYG